jgi:hypothetical protein
MSENCCPTKEVQNMCQRVDQKVNHYSLANELVKFDLHDGLTASFRRGSCNGVLPAKDDKGNTIIGYSMLSVGPHLVAVKGTISEIEKLIQI